MELTLERLKQLHEAARYAKTHGNGQVLLPADELLAVLPSDPVDVTPKAAEPSIAQNEVARELEPAPVEPVVEPTGPQLVPLAAEVTEPAVPAGAPMVDTPTLSQEEIDSQVKWDKDHPTQEEQERDKTLELAAAVRQIPGNEPLVDVSAHVEPTAPAIEPAPVTDAV